LEKLGHHFQPLRIGAMELENRIVMPGMDPSFGIDGEGRVTEEFTAFLVERARSGPGMIVSPAMAVHPTGIADPATVHMLLVSNENILPGLEGLVRAVHRHGVPFGAQLTHCGLGHLPALATVPSERPAGTEIGPTRAATREDIGELVRSFGLAAQRCIGIGFDFIEIHGAHAYLINEFLTPRYNRRTDEYGGPFENRIRFLLEVVREVRSRVGAKTPVGVRLGGDDFIGEGGWQLPELCRLAPILEKEGIDYINVTQGGFSYGTIQVNIAPMYEPQGAFVRFAAEVKKHVSIPVGTVGRIKDPAMADRIVKEGQADFVCMARAHLADPELVEKARRGDLADIRPCLAECLGCIEGIFRHATASCAVNPRVGREHSVKDIPGEKSGSPRRVLVAGAGVAGLEAARRAAFSGHKVTLCESRAWLGGQVRLAAMMPQRQEIADVLPWYERQLNKVGVEIRLNTAVGPDLLDEIKPDVLVLATGSLPEASLGFVEGLGNIEHIEMMMVDELLEDRRPTGERRWRITCRSRARLFT
jgi:2,4-dienoyl-CoA reductase-like NADH-dependent reductase (Old Yellow Enzyme family)